MSRPPIQFAFEHKSYWEDPPMLKNWWPDQPTSIAGAKDVKPRAGSQCFKLLRIYGQSYPGISDYNDFEAARAAGLLKSCYWKRCGELRDKGLIEVVYNEDASELTRMGDMGSLRKVCAITPKGKALLAEMESNG
jgi:hypothetical protein